MNLLLFLKTAKIGDIGENHPPKNTSIKMITLVEKDKIPVKIEDTSDEKDQLTEEDREIEPQKEKSTVTLRPKEPRKIPVLKPNTIKEDYFTTEPNGD